MYDVTNKVLTPKLVAYNLNIGLPCVFSFAGHAVLVTG